MRLRDLLDWPRAFLPQRRGGPIEITLGHGSEAEIRARRELFRLLERHDLRKWHFTHRVRIDERAPIPHSHPILTLNVRYEGDLLLSTYLHEQLHWFAWKQRGTKAAIRDLSPSYPDVPVALPEGAGSRFSSYLHYMVCYLEYAALADVLGEEEARAIIEHWSTHHYTQIYAAVLGDFDAIGEVVRRHGLEPE